MVLITIMEHLPSLRSLGLSLSLLVLLTLHHPLTVLSSIFLPFFLSTRVSLSSTVPMHPFARAHSRSRTAPLTPLRPSSTLCSVPRRWRQLSGYLKRKILISPLERVRFSRARLQWSFNGRRGSARRRGRGRHRRWRGEKKEKVTHHIAGALPLHPLRRHDATRDDAKRSVDAGTTLRVRSIARNSRESSSTALRRERKRKRGREPREKFRTSLSEIYRRRGRNKSMARDARERGWR